MEAEGVRSSKGKEEREGREKWRKGGGNKRKKERENENEKR